MKETKTKLHQIKLRCENCNRGLGKQLKIETQKPIDQALIDLFIFQALTHEQKHPNHQVEVIIYENAPETPKE